MAIGQQMTVQTRRWPIWVAVASAWLLWGTISTLRLAPAPDLSLGEAFWYGFPDALIWGALTPLVVTFARRWPLYWGRWWPTLVYHLMAAISFALLHAAADASIAAVRALVTSQEPLWFLVFFKVLAYGGHTNLLVYTLIAGLAHYVDYTRRLAESQRLEAALQAQLAAAQLANLERQLRPHFLFNALNTIASLMDDEATQGRRVVRQLGDLLRASLQHRPGQRIPLRDELSLVRDYLEIEQVRFEDRLRISYDVEDGDIEDGDIEDGDTVQNFPVPALILQPLVENAVAHGIAHRPEGGHIHLTARLINGRLEVCVEDDGPGIDPTQHTPHGLGLGLSTTRQRLDTLYGNHSDIEHLTIEPRNGGGTRIRLRFPRSISQAS